MFTDTQTVLVSSFVCVSLLKLAVSIDTLVLFTPGVVVYLL